MLFRFGVIVEGHGEIEAVPILLRRVALEIDPTASIQIVHRVRESYGSLVRPEALERAVKVTAAYLAGVGAILILLDCDDGCPAELGPHLLERAQKQQANLPVGVVLAKREFEAWFLAAAESLQGKAGLPPELQAPEDPEAIRGAKEWLGQKMRSQSQTLNQLKTYKETDDQARLTAQFDMNLARQRSDSFDKCYREVERLLYAQLMASPA